MTIRVTSTNGEIKEKIAKAIQRKLTKNILSGIENAAFEINFSFIERLVSSGTYKSITGADGIGVLRRDFGLDNASVSFFENNIERLFLVSYDSDSSTRSRTSKRGLTFKAGVSIELDFSFVDSFAYTTENGTLIPWMSWLLFEGAGPIIPNYRIFPKFGTGRSKLGITVKSEGSSWSVNSAYAGTENDNWLTRTLRSMENEFKNIVTKNIEVEIRK